MARTKQINKGKRYKLNVLYKINNYSRYCECQEHALLAICDATISFRYALIRAISTSSERLRTK